MNRNSNHSIGFAFPAVASETSCPKTELTTMLRLGVLPTESWSVSITPSTYNKEVSEVDPRTQQKRHKHSKGRET